MNKDRLQACNDSVHHRRCVTGGARCGNDRWQRLWPITGHRFRPTTPLRDLGVASLDGLIRPSYLAVRTRSSKATFCSSCTMTPMAHWSRMIALAISPMYRSLT